NPFASSTPRCLPTRCTRIARSTDTSSIILFHQIPDAPTQKLRRRLSIDSQNLADFAITKSFRAEVKTLQFLRREPRHCRVKALESFHLQDPLFRIQSRIGQ